MNGAPPDSAGKPVFRPLTELLEGAGNTLLRLDPDSLRRLSALQGSVLGIEVREPELRLYLLPSGEGLRIEWEHTAEADVILRGTLWSFARLGREGMRGELFHDGSLEMSGDAELGQQYQQFLGRLDLDWEELLSRLLGDTPARKLGNLLRGLGGWAEEAGESAQRNLGEFLQEERRDLASRLRSDEFIEGVDELRSDVERLAQRVGRMKNKF